MRKGGFLLGKLHKICTKKPRSLHSEPLSCLQIQAKRKQTVALPKYHQRSITTLIVVYSGSLTLFYTYFLLLTGKLSLWYSKAWALQEWIQFSLLLCGLGLFCWKLVYALFENNHRTLRCLAITLLAFLIGFDFCMQIHWLNERCATILLANVPISLLFVLFLNVLWLFRKQTQHHPNFYMAASMMGAMCGLRFVLSCVLVLGLITTGAY